MLEGDGVEPGLDLALVDARVGGGDAGDDQRAALVHDGQAVVLHHVHGPREDDPLRGRVVPRDHVLA